MVKQPRDKAISLVVILLALGGGLLTHSWLVNPTESTLLRLGATLSTGFGAIFLAQAALVAYVCRGMKAEPPVENSHAPDRCNPATTTTIIPAGTCVSASDRNAGRQLTFDAKLEPPNTLPRKKYPPVKVRWPTVTVRDKQATISRKEFTTLWANPKNSVISLAWYYGVTEVSIRRWAASWRLPKRACKTPNRISTKTVIQYLRDPKHGQDRFNGLWLCFELNATYDTIRRKIAKINDTPRLLAEVYQERPNV